MMVKPKSKRVFYGLRISMTIFLILIVSLFLSFRQLNSKNSGMAYIPYPVYDTIKIMESGVIHRYTTYSEGFYLSHEITNKEYREFTNWMKINPNESIYLINDTSTFVKNPKTGKTREMIFHLPKRIDVSEIMNEFIVSKAPYSPDSNHQNYFTDERYDDYPVLGVSRRMAEYYCSWKIKSETIITYDTIGGNSVMGMSNENTYRLPTEKEWDFVAQHYAKKEDPNLAKKEIQKSDEAGSIETGISHLDDNVSEWVTSDEGKKCIAKGGSWKRGSSISLRQVYDKDNEDETIGFRIVKSPRPKITSGSNSFNTKVASNISGKKESNSTTPIIKKTAEKEKILTPEDPYESMADFSGIWKFNNSRSSLFFQKGTNFARVITILQKGDTISFNITTTLPEGKPLKSKRSYALDSKGIISKTRDKTETVSAEWSQYRQSFSITTTLNYSKNGTEYEGKRVETYALADSGNTLVVNYIDTPRPEGSLTSVDEGKYNMVYDKILPVKNPFRVAVFADKSQGFVSKAKALYTNSLEVKILNYEGDLKYEITGFTFLSSSNNIDTEFKAEGNKLTDEMKSYIAHMKRQQSFIFKDIRALGSDGNTALLPPIIIQIE